MWTRVEGGLNLTFDAIKGQRIGNWKLEIGNWKLEDGDWKLELETYDLLPPPSSLSTS